ETDQNDSDEFLPFDYSLADDVITGDVRADKETRNWYFDGIPHTVLSVEKMTQRPEIGVLSAERQQGDNTVCVLDQLPPYATLIITFVIQARSTTKKHLDIMEKRSRAQTQESAASRIAIEHAREQLLNSNEVYPFTMAVALRADDDVLLERQME